jgi:glycosyltransferase involved in cell wall biosynthesis
MIAIIYPQFYGVGGIAHYLESFLSNLPERHPPLYLITGDEHRVDRYFPGVEIIHIPLSSNRLDLFIWGWKVRKLLTQLNLEGKIRLVNLHFPPLISCLFLPRHIPIVLTVHSTYFGMSGKFNSRKFYDCGINGFALKIKMWMESRIFGNASKAIALTEFGKQQIKAYGFDKPITIIPNGVDFSQFNISSDVSKDIDVLFTGRIEHLKGSNALVEICRLLVAAKKDISICIVGFGEQESWVRQQLITMAENITMTGKVPYSEMVGYYNRSKVYVSTSYYEGLPGTCLEAMAMQLPVVVWDFLFYRGLVIEGENGNFAEPNNYAGMVEKVINLLANPLIAEKMGRNGRTLLESNYNWTKLAKDILEVFARDE